MRRFRERTTETAGFCNTVGFNDDTRTTALSCDNLSFANPRLSQISQDGSVTGVLGCGEEAV